jgi:hypothetical protein
VAGNGRRTRNRVGHATLISDMGSGRWQGLLAGGHDGCRRKDRFSTVSPWLRGVEPPVHADL